MRSLATSLLLIGLIGCSQKTADQHIQAAQKYAAENNAAAAIVEYKNAIQMSPKSAETRFLLGELYFQQEQFASAEKELNRALEYGYAAHKILPMLAEAYKRTGAYNAMTDLDARQAELSPAEQLQVGYAKVDALVKLGKTEEALLLTEELLELDSASFYKPLLQAYASILAQDYTTALQQLTELRKSEPYANDVLLLNAQVLMQLERIPEATDVYLEYVKIHSKNQQIKFVLAKLLVDQSRLDEAEPFVDELLALAERNALLNQMKSLIMAAKEEHAEALKFASRAIQEGNQDPTTRLVAGFSAYQLRDYAEAHTHLSFVASALGNDHPALRMLAASQLQLGMATDAAEVVARIGNPVADDAGLFSKTSYELLKSGYVKRAEKVLEQTAPISASAEDLTRLGVLQLTFNNAQGLLNLEQAVEQAPSMGEARRSLASAYLANAEFDKALALTNEWIAIEPNNIDAYLLSAGALVRKGEREQAAAKIEQALAIDENNQDAKFALLSLNLGKDAQSAESQAQLTEFVNAYPDYVPALALHFASYSANGELDAGRAPILAALSRQPDSSALSMLAARSYAYDKQYTKALEYIQPLALDEQSLASLWLLKGQLLLAVQDLRGAESHYQDWLAIAPVNKDALLGRLLIHDSKNEFAEGEKLSADFLQERDDLQVKILQMHFLALSGETDKANAIYDELGEAAQQLAFVKGVKSRLQIADKDFVAALPNARAAYDGEPSFRNLLGLLVSLESTQQAEQGMALLSEYSQQNPKDVRGTMLLAERQIGQNVGQAMQSYRQILSVTPDNFVVLNNLAYLSMQNGNLQEAKKLAEKAVEINASSTEAIDTLAQVYVAEKDYKAALTQYQSVDIENTRSEEVYLNYVEALVANKQLEIAKRKLTSRQFAQPDSIQRAKALVERL